MSKWVQCGRTYTTRIRIDYSFRLDSHFTLSHDLMISLSIWGLPQLIVSACVSRQRSWVAACGWDAACHHGVRVCEPEPEPEAGVARRQSDCMEKRHNLMQFCILLHTNQPG